MTTGPPDGLDLKGPALRADGYPVSRPNPLAPRHLAAARPENDR